MIQKITQIELEKLRVWVNNAIETKKDSSTKWSFPNGYTAENISFDISDNMELAKLVNSITDYKLNDITSLHYINYKEGTFLTRHKDQSMLDISNPKGSVSIVFLLNMCEVGGEFYLDDVKTDFNEPGQYITFDGECTYHEVTEIKKGNREVLVLWYKPIREKTLL